MSHLTNIRNLSLRYQSSDPTLYAILSGVIDELDTTSDRHLSEDKTALTTQMKSVV